MKYRNKHNNYMQDINNSLFVIPLHQIKDTNVLKKYYNNISHIVWSKFNKKKQEQFILMNHIEDVYNSQDYEFDYALNLTLKRHNDLTPMRYEYVRQQMSDFIHQLNKRVYKRAYKRYKKRLHIFCAIEGGQSNENVVGSFSFQKNYHIHALIERPKYLTNEEFEEIILDIWNATKLGDRQNRIECVYNVRGFMNYQTKTSTQTIDLENTFIR